MKKKILSPEALAALAKGTQQGLPPAETPAAGADSGEGTTITIPTDSQEEQQEAEASAGTEAEAEETTDFEAQVVELTAELAEAATKAEAAQARIAELEAAVATHESASLAADAKVAAATEQASEFRDIVTGHIAVMRTALSLAAVDTEKWTNEAVLREYASIAESFEKALPEGSQVPEPKGQEQKTPPKTSLDSANVRSLGF